MADGYPLLVVHNKLSGRDRRHVGKIDQKTFVGGYEQVGIDPFMDHVQFLRNVIDLI